MSKKKYSFEGLFKNFFSRLKTCLIYSVRLFYIGSKRFYKDGCFEKASSLSYVTILSVVPVSILIFSFLSSYEYTSLVIENNINYLISLLFGTGLENDIASYLRSFAENVSSLSYLGIIFLLFISVDIILILEKSINVIWDIKKGRSFLQNFFIYWSILTITPFFLFSSIYLTSQYSFSTNISFEYFPFVVTLFGFFLVYIFLPRKKVYLPSAFIGALVAGLLFELSKIAFALYIAEIVDNTLKKIYGGTFYIIPIFIAWIYLSYAILLYGAQIAYLVQHPDVLKYKFYGHKDDNSFVLYFILNSLYHIYNRFQNSLGETSLKYLAHKNNISQLQMDGVATLLVEDNILTELASKTEKYYIPKKPQSTIKIIDIINMLDTKEQYILNSDNENAVENMFTYIKEKLEKGINETFGDLSLQDILIKESTK